MKTTTTRSTGSANLRLRGFLLVGVVVALAASGAVAVAAAAPSAEAPDRVPVATIDGATVTRAELDLHLERVRPSVENDVLVQTGSPVDDWAAPLADGGSPAARLIDAAVAELRSDRQVFALAKEHGLLSYDDFDGFTQALQAENAQRAADSRDGDVVYGSVAFTEQEYYSRTLEQLRTQLTQSLSSGEHPQLTVTDDDVVAYLRDHAGDWATNAAHYRLTRLAVPGDGTTETLDRAVAASGFDAVAAAQPESASSPAVFDGATQAFADGRTTMVPPQLVSQLTTLPVGGVTSAVTEQGDLVVYRIDAVDVDPNAALAQYGDRIRTVLQTQQLDALIAQRVADRTRQLDTTPLEALTLEELNR